MRPNLNDIPIPQLLKDLISRCWDADPNLRPTFNKLNKILDEWNKVIDYPDENSEFYRQYQKAKNAEIEEVWMKMGGYRQTIKTNPAFVYVSCLLNYKNLPPQPQNNPSQEWQTTTLLDLQIKGAKKELEIIKWPLNNELVELVDQFIEIKKQSLKDKENKQIKRQSGEIKRQLKEKGVSEEKLDEIILQCEKLAELEQKVKCKGRLQAQIEFPNNK